MAQIAKKTRAAKGMSDGQRAALAQGAAKLLRRKGPMPTARLLELLGAEGLSVTEALSVVNHGFSHQLLMRDPHDPTGIAAGTVSLPAPRRASVKPPPPPPPVKRARRRKATAATSPVAS
jgi:hypothetical protein